VRADAPAWRNASKKVPDRLRAVGVLIAELRVADALVDPDARPVRVELVGRDHRERGANAGSHLRAVGDDVHRAVRIDSQIDARVQRRRVGLRPERRGLSQQIRRHEPRRDDQGAGREDTAEKVAAADVGRGDAGAHERAPAARLIAARIR
jgi:hypothetical protein